MALKVNGTIVVADDRSLINTVGITASGAIRLTQNATSTSTSTGTLVVTGGTGITENLNVGGTTNLSTLNVSGNVTVTSTGFIKVPVGTTAERPTAAQGQIRFNTSFLQFEGYNGTAWGELGGGAKGAPPNAIFFENDQSVTGSYTITSGKNAMTAGPVTVNDGVVVTIPDGGTWTIV